MTDTPKPRVSDAADMFLDRGAKISLCGTYRYWLSRRWAAGPLLAFIMLNPSVADDRIDDPTIRRCMGFGRREGAGGIIVGNLFAGRATKPESLLQMPDPIGEANEENLRQIVRVSTGQIICAWGAGHPKLPMRRAADCCISILADAGAEMVCLGKTSDGSPRHPLYIRADEPFEAFP